MLANRLGGELRPASDPEATAQALETNGNNDSLATVTSKPFRERRRTRPLRQAWHETLNVLNDLLLGYEKANAQIAEDEEKYRRVFEEALVGIFQVSPSGRLLTINREFAHLYGYETAEQLLREVRNVRQLVRPDQLKQWKRGALSGDASAIFVEVESRDGTKKFASLKIRAVRDTDGKMLYFEGTAEDVTIHKEAWERLHLLAYHDSLTGLPNATLFAGQLDDALARCRTTTHPRAALLLIEVDRFKLLNDSFGRVFGDRLLQECAERLRRCVGDKAIVARLGGGEFAVLPTAIHDMSDAGALGQRLISAVSAEFSTAGNALSVSCNLGISMFPESGEDGASLLRNAEVALFVSKQDGPGKWRFFTEEMDAHIVDRLRLENDLQLAVERNELFLLYQPQVDIRTSQITGLEALLRWQHPRFGLVPPGDFIGVAETSGLIVPIGEWVLRTACAQAKKWQDAGLPAVPIGVNVSAVQFRRQGFVELVERVLRETKLPPHCLELELTESLLLTNADVMFSILQELRDMGVKLAIDDFGTGYSSLSYLRQFRVNRLKIDRSFIRDVAVSRDDAAITIAIIEMAKALHLEVLAEGVETEAQLDFLRAQNCHEIQGFYFSKPLTETRVAERLLDASIEPAVA